MTNELIDKTWYNNEMSEKYENFMVFSLHDSGEKERINITETDFLENNGTKILNPKQVVLIVNEELRRIYIWKGSLSSVRKKFIASRVASELQSELTKSAYFHRCKIISVDQGDEPYEFLHNFGFTSMKKSELMQKEILQSKPIIKEDNKKSQPIKLKTVNSKSTAKKTLLQQSYQFIKSASEMKKKIIEKEVPEGYQRSNLILGSNLLYSLVSKKTEVFGKTFEETEWEPVTNGFEEMIQFEGFKVRVYFDVENGIINAIELLEPISVPKIDESKIEEQKMVNYASWTVKKLKEFCTKHNIKVLSRYRKAELVKLVETYNDEQN